MVRATQAMCIQWSSVVEWTTSLDVLCKMFHYWGEKATESRWHFNESYNRKEVASWLR
jgi:hypothetical protein